MGADLLHTFLRHAQEMDEEAFESAFPWPFLVPMGLDKALAAPEIDDRTPRMLRQPVALVGPHPLAGRVFPLRAGDDGRGLLRVGRAADNDLVLPERAVSERHCLLQADAGGVTVQDLGSRNGTFIDDERIPPLVAIAMRDESVLTVARYRLQLLGPATFRRMAREIAGLTPVT